MLRLSLQEVGPWLDGIGKQLPRATKRGLYSAALRISQKMASDGQWPVDKGTSRAGWRAEATDQGADVFNIANNSIFIDESVRAENVKIGRAMIQALTEWVKRKGIGNTFSHDRQRSTDTYSALRARKPGADERAGIAWAIAKSMQKRGIFQPPKHLLAKAVALYGPTFVREEVGRELKRELMGF